LGKRLSLEIGQFKKIQEWRTIDVRIRNSELSLLNRQLDRLNYWSWFIESQYFSKKKILFKDIYINISIW
jgi:hypothetical protein